MISSEQKNTILTVVAEFQPTLVGVFGSYARGDNATDSDLDILIDFEHTPNLLDIIGLEQELTERLGLKVDLITLRSLHPQLKPHVEQDLISLMP